MRPRPSRTNEAKAARRKATHAAELEARKACNRCDDEDGMILGPDGLPSDKPRKCNHRPPPDPSDDPWRDESEQAIE